MATERFASVSEGVVSDLLKNKNSENTHKATNVSWNVFISYLDEKSLVIDIESCSAHDLKDILRKFYIELRKQDGTLYCKTSFNSIRSGIQRKIKVLRPEIDIIIDKDFQAANEVFRAQCVELKKEGLAKITHKQPITVEDMKTLYMSPVFSVNNPVSLQRKVFFDVLLYLCRRGQENLRYLKKRDFVIKTDAYGKEYVEKVVDEMTKNRRESNEAEEGGVIYETGSQYCPVSSFKAYISHLNPNIDEFFQRPKSFAPKFGPWYEAQVLGVNYIGNMMKKISINAKLSTVYTNHCIRATAVTILDQSGVEARHIMAVSGHRSESSIRSYSRTSIGMKRKMLGNLSKFCEEDPTFDLGIDFLKLEDDLSIVNEVSNIPPYKKPLAVVPVVSQAGSESSLSNNANVALSSFIGSSAHYVEFSDCTFNFKQTVNDGIFKVMRFMLLK